jgi:hypothetical protein
MNIQEQRKLLSDAEGLRSLFNYYLDKLSVGSPLEEGEISMYEYCKKVFVDGQPIVGDMSATMVGSGGLQ